MKLAIVVQRYGADINGGAELHARYIAERLSAQAEVRVLTTCARDYVTWRNEFPPGEDEVNGIPVERFRVAREREHPRLRRPIAARLHAGTIRCRTSSTGSTAKGRSVPACSTRLRRSAGEFDFVVLFSVRYHQAYHGARAVPSRAVLVPTAEREPALGLAIFQPIFRGVRAIMYNSLEERAAIHGARRTTSMCPGVVVGVGSMIPAVDRPGARATGVRPVPSVRHLRRADRREQGMRGAVRLLPALPRIVRAATLDLVLIGTPVMPIPPHPRIRHLGFVSDQDKFDVLAAAEALVMPSYFESLSMVALEAWALGRPVLANARCDVLLGQCLRSNAGLYYENAGEFGAALDRLLDDAGARGQRSAATAATISRGTTAGR